MDTRTTDGRLAAWIFDLPVVELRAGYRAAVYFDDWDDYETTVVYAGPTISYQGGKIGSTDMGWWVTVTPAVQLTDVDDETDFQLRMIAGLEF